jgi:hypothetical protein
MSGQGLFTERNAGSWFERFAAAWRELDELADPIVRRVRRDDLAQATCPHNLTDRDGRQVRRRLADPGAVRGIQRDPAGAHKSLTLADLRNRLLHELKRPVVDPPGRALAKYETAIHIGHGSNPTRSQTTTGCGT